MFSRGDRPRRSLPLRAHLLLLVVGTVLPALVVAGLLIRRVVADNQASIENGMIATARAQAAIVDRELTGTIRALQALAQSDRLATDELPSFRAQAVRLVHEQPMWFAVILWRLDGQQIMNTAGALDQPLPAAITPAVFAPIVATRQPMIGDLRVGRVTNQTDFPVHVPVIRNDQVLYVLTALITSSAFGDVLRREAAMPDEWVRGVVDGSGVVVARSRDAERFVGQRSTPAFLERYQTENEGVYRDTALDGTPVYGAFSHAPYSRWIAGVAVPAGVVDRAFNQSMAALGVLGITLLGAGGVAAFVISRRIAGDISDVADAAQALARGERPRLPSSSVSEVQQLSSALDRSALLRETRERERNEQIERADQARRDAEGADRAKDDFLAMLGHELRNPLAPALTALHLIRHRYPEMAAREHEIISRQILHMARLVDDLLDVSRLRRQVISLRRETFHLREAIERAAEMTAPLYAERRHQLAIRVPEDVAIVGDPVRMAQVFANLLTNAAKYTEPDGHVVVSGRVEGSTVVVDCQDDGIGMSADLLPHVFDLFVQGERGLDRHQGGLGLGLALSRALIERHGGTIASSSDGPGRGSIFTVRLPVAPIDAEEPLPVEPARGSNIAVGSARVLVVDDNRDAVEMLVAALRDAGFQAVGATDGVEALAIAGGIEAQVAVLDIGLPSLDGFQLARMLRAATPSGLRLVALTGYGQDQDMAAAREAGFEKFFVKPAPIDALIQAINELVTASSAG
jgi:signal transduction histidine kinase/ActR/RegA family two-component response regulator